MLKVVGEKNWLEHGQYVQILKPYIQMQLILLKTSPLIKLGSPAIDIPQCADLTAVPWCYYTTTIIATVLMFLRIVSKVYLQCVCCWVCMFPFYILQFIQLQFTKYDSLVLQINNETCIVNRLIETVKMLAYSITLLLFIFFHSKTNNVMHQAKLLICIEWLTFLSYCCELVQLKWILTFIVQYKIRRL